MDSVGSKVIGSLMADEIFRHQERVTRAVRVPSCSVIGAGLETMAQHLDVMKRALPLTLLNSSCFGLPSRSSSMMFQNNVFLPEGLRGAGSLGGVLGEQVRAIQSITPRFRMPDASRDRMKFTPAHRSRTLPVPKKSDDEGGRGIPDHFDKILATFGERLLAQLRNEMASHRNEGRIEMRGTNVGAEPPSEEAEPLQAAPEECITVPLVAPTATAKYVCEAIVNGERRLLTWTEYWKLCKKRDCYDLFIDGMNGGWPHGESRKKEARKRFTRAESDFLWEVVKAGRRVFLRETRSGKDHQAPSKTFQSALRKADRRTSRYTTRFFTTHRREEKGAPPSYEFTPPKGKKYCIIRPLRES